MGERVSIQLIEFQANYRVLPPVSYLIQQEVFNSRESTVLIV